MKEIIVYGIGNVFLKYHEKLLKDFKIVAYVDKNRAKCEWVENKAPFVGIDEINKLKFDCIVVCGSEKIKNALFIDLDGKYSWNDIITVHQVYKSRITWEKYKGDIAMYESLNTIKEFPIVKNNLRPILEDISSEAGEIDEHYFLQDIWVAQKVGSQRPDIHYDIGSRIDGFISHLLVMKQKVTQIDIRPLNKKISGLDFICADATNLENVADGSIGSLSSLHAIEHFGLGRYGDKIDPDACYKVTQSIQRVVMENGRIYVSVPCGSENKLVFNAHRIFNPYTFANYFKQCMLEEFCYIKDFTVHSYCGSEIEQEKENILSDIGEYSCGIFVLRKL